jgi:citrate lyase beta subunit
MTARKASYRAIRSVFEAPILDERKWAKVPEIPADLMFIDIEDSVAPARKEEARDVAVHYIKDPTYFGGRPTLARPNHLSTPWGRDDVIAFAEAGVELMAYPKIQRYDELLEVVELMAEYGARPDIYAIAETSGSMLDLRQLTEHPQVVSVMFGPGDMSVDIGIPMLEPDGELNRVFNAMKSSVVLAASAAQIACTDIVFAPDFRDFDEVRRRARVSRMLGFTALATFYPPHVEIIHEIFTPTPAEVSAAQEIVEVYEAVLAEGKPAALGPGGETILVHDYHKALSVLAKVKA